MRRARAVPRAENKSCGVGQVNAVRAVMNATRASNPNAALNRFLKTDAATGLTVFDAVSWTDVSKSDVSWDAVSWTDVSWSDVSWDAVSWSDVSWTDVSWSDVSWSDVSWEDAAEEQGTPDGSGVPLTPEEEAAVADGSGARSAPTDARARMFSSLLSRSTRHALDPVERYFRATQGPALRRPLVLTLSGELAMGYPARGMPHPEGAQ